MSSLNEVLENTEKVKTENGTFFRLHDKVDQLEAENAKLRELVRMMLRVAGVAEYATDIEWQTITHYLRELGMEVDDGNY